MQSKLVSLVIPTHNRKQMLERLIESILGNTYKNIEIIIIDDASSDGTFEYIKKKFKTVKIFRNTKNLFTAGSRNVGFKKAKGEFVFFVDDDNELDKNIISSLAEVLVSDDSVGEVGPINYSFNNKKKILWARTKRNMWTSKTNQSRSLTEFENEKLWETADIPNAFMVRTSIVSQNKIFFREKYGIMYEESDYAYRIRNKGFKILVAKDAKIYHDIENKLKGNKNKDYMFHFMEDKRRFYVFARNRIIFHSIFSNKLQFSSVILFGIWIFAFYYSYKILFYKGIGKFSILHRAGLIFSYFNGTFEGLRFVITGEHLT
jgi:GT2 family glycosyltransferase